MEPFGPAKPVLPFAAAATAREVAVACAQAVASGSYLIISVASGNRSEGENFTTAYTAAQVYIHSPEEITSFFDGLELMPPPPWAAWPGRREPAGGYRRWDRAGPA